MGIAKFGVKHQGEMGKLPVQKSYFTSQNEPTIDFSSQNGDDSQTWGNFLQIGISPTRPVGQQGRDISAIRMRLQGRALWKYRRSSGRGDSQNLGARKKKEHDH